ncbi:MAG: hypothetical protein R8G66_31675 [Cytophagales bacterium]|nr:hypothetical protein [Cytophagales bacterium]
MSQSRTGLKLRPSKSQTDHPHHWELLVNFFLIATAALFIYVSAAYFATWYSGDTHLSKFLIMGFLLLLPSSHFMLALPRHFDMEADKKMVLALGLSLLSLVIFFVFQWLAWSDKIVQSPDSSPFIYALSIAHGAYFLLVFVVTLFQLIYVRRNQTDMVKRLIYYSNGFQRMKLVLLARVWLFLNILWGAVIFAFLLIS